MNYPILNKFLSGRFLLTLIAGITFMIMSCHGLIEPNDAMVVIMVVVTSYFQKPPTAQEPTDTVPK